MRVLFGLSLGLVCGLAALYGLRLRAPDTTTAIARVAALHVTRVPDARPEDCVATPGTGDVWIEVSCSGRVQTVYRLDRRGQVIGQLAMDGPGAGL